MILCGFVPGYLVSLALKAGGVLRVPDECAYYKEDAGKMMLGAFEPVAKPWGTDGIREDFCFDQLPEDIGHFEPILERAVQRFPLLQTAGIHTPGATVGCPPHDWLTLLTALEQPDSYHLGTLISDEPVTIKGENGKLWEPNNVDAVSHGEVPMFMALTHSYNQATARLGMQLGLENVYDTVKAAGFEGRIPGVPSMLLGSVDMSAFEVAGIYHTLAAEGVYTPLRSIREVLTADGQPLRRYPLELEQRFSLESTFQLQYALQMVLREGTGRSVYNQFPESLPLAGKTGTTNDQRDSWFAGFSGEHLAVVWLGRDDNSATPLTGSGGALQVWADLMRQLPTQGVNLQPPEGVSFDWIDAATGMLSAEHCEGAVWLPLRDSQRPEQQSDCRLKEGGRNWWQRLWN